MKWESLHIKRIILDLSLKVTNGPFTGNAAFYRTNGADWYANNGLDSMELMSLAAAVNSFFNLFEIKDPPYLLSSTRVDEWVEMVYDARQRWDESLSFNTSGTTGEVKIIKHSLAYLQREINFVGTLFPQAGIVIPYVPAYTIYGFLFTVGLPQSLQFSLLFPSEVNWQQLFANILIVGTPFNWQFLADSLPVSCVNCFGASAGAPLVSNLYSDILSKGIRLTEIYGATETSGIGYRHQPDDLFKLFPYWEFTDGGEVRDLHSGEVKVLMDASQILNNGSFRVNGRKDKKVNVAGRLVDLAAVAGGIEKLDNVKKCDLSAKASGGEVMIHAVITLTADSELARAEVKDQIRRIFPAHEKPRMIYFD